MRSRYGPTKSGLDSNMLTYFYDASNKTVFCSVKGTITHSEVLELFDRYLEDETIPRGAIEVVNFDPQASLNVDFKDAIKIHNKYREILKKKAFQTTVFETKTLPQYAAARIIKATFENINYCIEIKRG